MVKYRVLFILGVKEVRVALPVDHLGETTVDKAKASPPPSKRRFIISSVLRGRVVCEGCLIPKAVVKNGWGRFMF